MDLGVTLVICTYNGAALLPETIKHIAAQQVNPNIAWEVIIVDNASTDNTSQVALSEWEKQQSTVSFSLLHQAKPGLTFAREVALSNAQYEFILFCDDDNWLNPDYVNLAYQIMVRNENIGVLGGHGEAIFETPPPDWAARLNLFAVGPQAHASGIVKSNAVYGAGCVLRKSAYDKIAGAGFRSLLTDRKGNSLSSGGDYELCYALALAGYEIWYDERLTFKHFMPQKRINIEYFNRYYADNAKSFEVLIPYRIRVNLGAKNFFSFYLNLIRILTSYTAKLLFAIFKRTANLSGSDKLQANYIGIKSLRYKLLSFKCYKSMRENFYAIINFEQKQLTPRITMNNPACKKVSQPLRNI